MSSTAREFIESLILPEPHEYEALAASVDSAEENQPVLRKFNASAEENQPVQRKSAERIATAQVNAGSLTSFVGDIDVQQKSDVMNSTLLAQLGANKQYDRFTDPMRWYKFYIQVLQKVGWNIPGFAFEPYTSGKSTINLDSEVLKILARIATHSEIELIAATINCLKGQSAGSKALNIWDANTSSGNSGSFQIFPVASVNDTVVMVLNAMQFKATTSHGGFLWWTWSSTQIQVQTAAGKFELNNDIYRQNRQQVLDKIGDKSTTFISDLDI
jgi:hypothetical protein